jgi:hypothetical protein
MIMIDGKPVDLSKPETLKGITLRPGGSITIKKDGVVTTLTNPKPEQEPNHGNPSNVAN